MRNDAHGLVRNFLSRLPFPDRLSAPTILVEEDGDLGIDWDGTVSASLSPSGVVSWAALIGDWQAHGHFTLPAWPHDFNDALTRLGAVPGDSQAVAAVREETRSTSGFAVAPEPSSESSVTADFSASWGRDGTDPRIVDEKHERDSVPRFSQYEVDALTKPLHAKIEALTQDLSILDRLHTKQLGVENALFGIKERPPGSPLSVVRWLQRRVADAESALLALTASRDALVPYVRHKIGCPAPGWHCTCGLADQLAPGARTRTEKDTNNE